jgi:ubiquinone/menaquinone biosynthesis C-methylase UbiE
MKQSKLKLYNKEYASMLIRGIEEARPWNLEEQIKNFLTLNHTILDIGAGDARKLIGIASYCKKIVALEPSSEMRELANKLIAKNNITNIEMVDGLSEKLPFQNSYFDIVTSMLAPWNSEEVFRVLKPGGYFINEAIGGADKIEFKQEFGKDEDGNWRGSLMQLSPNEFIQQYQEKLKHRFMDIIITEGYWDTYYTTQGLVELCQNTSTIKDFDVHKDNKYLDEVAKKLTTDKGIKITQNRLLIIAKKP